MELVSTITTSPQNLSEFLNPFSENHDKLKKIEAVRLVELVDPSDEKQGIKFEGSEDPWM